MRCFRCAHYFAPSTCDACQRVYWLGAARAATAAETPASPPPHYEEVARPDATVPIFPLRVTMHAATGQRDVVLLRPRLE